MGHCRNVESQWRDRNRRPFRRAIEALRMIRRVHIQKLKRPDDRPADIYRLPGCEVAGSLDQDGPGAGQVQQAQIQAAATRPSPADSHARRLTLTPKRVQIAARLSPARVNRMAIKVESRRQRPCSNWDTRAAGV